MCAVIEPGRENSRESSGVEEVATPARTCSERVDVPCLPTTGRRLRQMKAIFQEMGSLNSNTGGGKEEMVVGLFETGSE